MKKSMKSVKSTKTSVATILSSAPVVCVVSKQEAIEQGLSPSFLRTLANSLERIARSSGKFLIEYEYNKRGDKRETTLKELQNFDPQGNFKHAYELRRLAKEIS